MKRKKKSPQLKYYYRNKAKIAERMRLTRLLFRLQAKLEDMETVKEKYESVQKMIAEKYGEAD